MIWLEEILSFLDIQIAQERTWTGGITKKGSSLTRPGNHDEGVGQDQNDEPENKPEEKNPEYENISDSEQVLLDATTVLAATVFKSFARSS